MVNFHTFTYDVETTGLSLTDDRIVEISWILLDEQFERVKAHTQLINPTIAIPHEVVKIHGIKNSHVIDKPTFKQYFEKVVFPVLTKYDPMIGGFNSKRFDDQIFQEEINRAGIDLPITEMRSLDAGTLYKRMNPRTLEACAIEYLGEEEIEKLKLWFVNNRESRTEDNDDVFHTAEFDTILTAKIIKKMFERHDDLPKDADELNKMIHKQDPNDIDLDGKFRFKNGEAIITFGKHNGTKLRELAIHERDYLSWMLNQGFMQDTKSIIKDALAGNFPTLDNASG